ncbi:MAG: ABC transporter permease [Desulfosarcinaceae bacterium]
MSFEWFIAKRYLRIRHQRRLVSMITLLAILGVAVGVMVLQVVIAVMSGFQVELKHRILGIEAHMVVMRYNEWIQDYDQLIHRIEKIPGVQSAEPFVLAQGMLRSADGVEGVQLRGIAADKNGIRVQNKGGKDLSQLSASEPGAKGETEVILGDALAQKLGVKVGNSILLMVAGTRQANPRRVPEMRRLKVVGLFSTGMHQYDANMGFVNIRQLQKLIGIPNLATGIEIRLVNPDAVDVMTRRISADLGFEYWVNNWKNMHRNLFAMLAMQKLVMYVIMTLIILVAAFNIASALIMMVREKTREIAILKAMGAPYKSIQKIFLGKGMAIGLAGIAIGVCGGLSACWALARYQFVELPGDVYFLTTLPVEVNLLDLSIIILGTLLICTIASFYPAGKAAKMNPVDALRY